MASVTEHYDQHLGPVYRWMLGDMKLAREYAYQELTEMGISPTTDGVAVDLGAGPGVHALPLAEMGYKVLAVDSCAGLLDELERDAIAGSIQTVTANLLDFRQHLAGPADTILCMGDTLTHLPDFQAIETLFAQAKAALKPGGHFLATFRNYSTAPPTGPARFIPVRSDANRILTCFLEYAEHQIMVHDLLHTWDGTAWRLQVSAYPKLRLHPDWVVSRLETLGFDVQLAPGPRGMLRLSAIAT